MNPMLSTSLPIVTVWVAAILGLLGSVLTLNVILNRVRSGVGTGDGGKPALAQAIRAHCNFTEQAPLALSLLAAAEMTLVRTTIVGIFAVLLVASRLASAYGLSQTLGVTAARQFGGGMAIVLPAAMSLAVLLALVGIR